MASAYKSKHHQNMSPGPQKEFNGSICPDQTVINLPPLLEKTQWCTPIVHHQLPIVNTVGINIPQELCGPF